MNAHVTTQTNVIFKEAAEPPGDSQKHYTLSKTNNAVLSEE